MTYLVEQLSGALADLAIHAGDMQIAGVLHHDNCVWCETMILLSRCGNFGKQLRDIELQEIPRERTA